jgi:hypothetical protein
MGRRHRQQNRAGNSAQAGPNRVDHLHVRRQAGQAAGICEKFAQWTDTNDEPERELSRDEVLDNITLYGLSNTGVSSARLYFESYATDFSQQLDIPVGVSVFPRELYRPLKVWGERSYSFCSKPISMAEAITCRLGSKLPISKSRRHFDRPCAF